GPIMGIGLALVDFDSRLLWRALLTLTAGTAMVLGVSVLCGLIAPPMSPSPEMLSRTSPRLLDLIVALASGFTTQGGQTVATAVVRSPVRFTNADVAAMEKRLPRSPDGSPVRQTLRHVEVDIVGDGG